jgi:hypothetical protein
MISFTFVLATGVKLIMIPFASASGPKPPAIYMLIITEPYAKCMMTGSMVVVGFTLTQTEFDALQPEK